MNERLAPVIDLTTRRRLDTPQRVETSPDELTPTERAQAEWQYDQHTSLAEHHWRMAEPYARKLGLLGIERGLYESEGQLPLLNVIEDREI